MEYCLPGYGRGELHAEFWLGNLRDRRPRGRLRRRWEDNININLREVGWGMKWSDVAQDRDRWRAVVNAVMNLRAS
jgi:hypothetical protein